MNARIYALTNFSVGKFVYDPCQFSILTELLTVNSGGSTPQPAIEPSQQRTTIKRISHIPLVA